MIKCRYGNARYVDAGFAGCWLCVHLFPALFPGWDVEMLPETGTLQYLEAHSHSGSNRPWPGLWVWRWGNARVDVLDWIDGKYLYNMSVCQIFVVSYVNRKAALSYKSVKELIFPLTLQNTKLTISSSLMMPVSRAWLAPSVRWWQH